MEKKRIIQVDFTGRDLSNGKVFDTTTQEIAEREGFYTENKKFAPMTVILGKGEMHKALEEEIDKMVVGEQKKIVLEPEKAFGERKPENIAVLPLKNFLDNKMNPFPGMVFEANGLRGKVQSVSGGRVRVDFNHPLAGKTLEYEIKLVKEISDKKEAIAALFEKFLPVGEEKDRKFELKNEELTIWLPKQLDLKNAEPFKKIIEKIMIENIEGIKKVSFFEAQEAQGKAAAESAKEKTTEQAENKIADSTNNAKEKDATHPKTKTENEIATIATNPKDIKKNSAKNSPQNKRALRIN